MNTDNRTEDLIADLQSYLIKLAGTAGRLRLIADTTLATIDSGFTREELGEQADQINYHAAIAQIDAVSLHESLGQLSTKIAERIAALKAQKGGQ